MRLFDDTTTLLSELSAGKFSSAELLAGYLDQLDRHGAKINAVVARDVDAARRRAQEADEARARGQSWGPLHGLPMTIKDSFEVTGMPTASGAPALKHHRPSANADAVQRLVDAGAIVYGKTNLPLFAGEWQSFNAVYGTTNNPWDTGRTPGGSSGGAAASLAAGFTPLELGSDIGGSIRIPAHFCGVFGHKPTYGLISQRGHVPGPPGTVSEPDLAVAGPMARSVDDLELALGLLAGPRSEDAAWSLSLPEAPARALSEYRVAVWFDDSSCPLESDVGAALNHARRTLEDAGMRTLSSATSRFRLSDYVDPYIRLLGAVMGTGLPKKVLTRMRVAQPFLKAKWRFQPSNPLLPMYLDGILQSHRRWLSVHEKRQKMRAKMRSWFEDVDVLLMPVAPWTSFPHAHEGDILTRQIQVPSGQRDYVDHIPWISMPTLLGLPSTSAPIGRSPDGLPVNVQVVSARYRDRTCLAFARELERVLGGFVPPPGFESPPA